MKIEGKYTFHADQDQVWSALMDPEILANTLPGGHDLEKVSENQFKAKMKIRIGPVQGLFSGKVDLSDVIPPQSYHLVVEGKGAPGFVKGAGDLRLEGNGGDTTLHYSGEAQVGGRLASVGQRLMESSAHALVRQSLETLDAQITARRRPDDSGQPIEMPDAPSEMQFATGVARKLVEDIVTGQDGRRMVQTALMAIAALLVMRFLADWWAGRLARSIARELDRRR